MTEPSSEDPQGELLATPLYGLHVALGARMVPFAGYAMPVQYPAGILAEHKWTREAAGLFDVSHMGQAVVEAPDWATAAAALETLVPADVAGLAPGRQRYTQLLNEAGGIVDDLMIARPADPASGRLMLVLNASRKHVDVATIAARLPAGVTIAPQPDRALLALQGPKAGAVLEAMAPDLAGTIFMDVRTVSLDGWIDATVSRSGYTGEDGFEISVAADVAEALARRLLDHPDVHPIGLGARDSLRLEAGLCLYGHEIDETTSPVEAGLVWSIQKRRRDEGGFPGIDRFRREMAEGPARVRVGILPEGRAPAREGTEIRARDGRPVGVVTSGGFAPTLNAPVAMGYVEPALAAPGTELDLVVRGKPLPARVAALPFVLTRFKRRSL
ncbi:glycine cleavage system aminomethyltransferase GcvT [Prosthecomicrobium sp. N25]|uniref:glycine cleavage system aminomethyltransferase GcvT n=1 Tax=Prosthecomicrobium sp. N25 TaxID=3129254 RepID=UPI0030771242